MQFRDRTDAGALLAEALASYADEEDVLVLGLPRGGVILAAEVARCLGQPLDILNVRKIGAFDQPELAVGAVGPNGTVVWNDATLRELGLNAADFQGRVVIEQAELGRRETLFRASHPSPEWQGATVILVDDGLATGATARAAIQTLRALRVGQIILAVPVGARSTVEYLRRYVDHLICLYEPTSFEAVSHFYQHFPQVSDQEVVTLLQTFWNQGRLSSIPNNERSGL